MPLRNTVAEAPDHKPLMPSSRKVVTAQCTGPLYFMLSFDKPFCCWRRIFTTCATVWRYAAWYLVGHLFARLMGCMPLSAQVHGMLGNVITGT